MTTQYRLAVYDSTQKRPPASFGPTHSAPLTAEDKREIQQGIVSFNKSIHGEVVALFPWTLADQLRAALRKSHMTERELAKLAGVPMASLRNFLDGRDVCLSRAAKICAALGLTL